MKAADLTSAQRHQRSVGDFLFPYDAAAAASAATGRQRPLCASFQMNVFVVLFYCVFPLRPAWWKTRCEQSVKSSSRLLPLRSSTLQAHWSEEEPRGRSSCFVIISWKYVEITSVVVLALIIVMVQLSFFFLFRERAQEYNDSAMLSFFAPQQNLCLLNKTEQITKITYHWSHFL